MAKRAQLPIALTIAGSDSGGGAGIQADLKTFAALGLHGTSALTCITAQNPRGVRGLQAIRPALVTAQIEAVFAALPPAAVKTGMLYSAAIIRAVAAFFSGRNRPPLVVDPVMVATSGAPLLKANAVQALTRELLPRAVLATPNLDETAILVGTQPTTVEAMRAAAREVVRRYGCAALIKGGHLRGGRTAVDIFNDGEQELLLEAPVVRGIGTHGTGCTYSAAIAGELARGRTLPEAVAAAKQFVTQAIAQSQRAARHDVLNSFWR
jgi:hydroxymethylpyrimidine/phosphomethylpyrimidine kinase